MNAAHAWDRDSYATAIENEVLNDVARKLSLIVTARRTERWDTARTVQLQQHVLAVTLSELTAVNTLRGHAGPRIEHTRLVWLRNWRMAR